MSFYQRVHQAARTLLSRGVLLFVCLLCHSAQAEVLLLLSSDAPYYGETANSLKTAAGEDPTNALTFKVLTLQSPEADTALTQTWQLIVAIGSKATQQVLSEPGNSPVLSIFTPKNAFENIKVREDAGSPRSVSVIYLDQPLERVVNLATRLMPEAKQLGAVFGPISKTWEDGLKSLASQRGIALNSAHLTPEDNPVAVLRPLVRGSDLFIALPDHAPLNRAVAKWILHLSFQQKVPVIGFSKAYTNAGALASIYSSPEDIGRQAGQFIVARLIEGDTTLPQAQYPRYFTISTNFTVAGSLGIHLPPDNELYRSLEQQETTLP